MSLILASTSKYRRKLMADAGFEVVCAAPEYEEKTLPGLGPLASIAAHARNKAVSLVHRFPNDIIIGSDQGLVDGDRLIGKPGTVDAACAQLQSLKGHTAILATSLTVIHGEKCIEYQNQAKLHFREDLSDETIRAYVQADMPLDCAGSFMIESRGSRLFSAIECDDPTAIQGLPMMRLNQIIIELDSKCDVIF